MAENKLNNFEIGDIVHKIFNYNSIGIVIKIQKVETIIDEIIFVHWLNDVDTGYYYPDELEHI